MEKCKIINKSVNTPSFGAEVLRSIYGNKDIDLTPAQIVQCFCHLDLDKMADTISIINKNQKQPFQPIEIKTLDIPHPKEPIKLETDAVIKEKKEIEKKKHEFPSGECCPVCGSIEYYQSGTCKSCRACGYAGGCG